MVEKQYSDSNAIRLQAIALRVEDIARRVEAIASRVEEAPVKLRTLCLWVQGTKAPLWHGD